MKRVLISGGAGFIGGCLIRRLLKENKYEIFNLDKISYVSNLDWLKKYNNLNKYHLLNVDLVNFEATNLAIKNADPDIIIHLSAESHEDRSLKSPKNFIDSNITGTFNILEASKLHWNKLSDQRKNKFIFYHVSTDEVYGSLSSEGYFSENSPYNPNSPYSASKAASDHLVNAWHKTYNLPTIISNCSNNFGPWQYPEKLIPLTIIKALNWEKIPVYGDGRNIRDWLFVEDHIDAILLLIKSKKIGKSFCIGGYGEKSNLEVVNSICKLLDKLKPNKNSYSNLINFVNDRPGHDFRYAIDSSLLTNETGWRPKHSFEDALINTVNWYIKEFF